MRLAQAPRNAPNRMPTRRPPTRGARKRFTRKYARASVIAAERIGLMRLRRSWPLLSAVGLGILVAVVLICTVPLFNALITDIELQRQVNAQDNVARNVEIRADSNQVAVSVRADLDPKVASLATTYLSGLTSFQQFYYVQTGETLLSGAGASNFDISAQKPPQARFQGFDFATVGPHMHVLDGRLPQSVQGVSAPEILVTDEMRKDFKLKLGDTLTVSQFGDHSRTLSARIVGIWTPTETNDPFWNGLSFAATGSDDVPKIYPVQMPVEMVFAHLSSFADLSMSQHWIRYTQPDRITTESMDKTASNLSTLRSHVSGDLLGVNGVSSATLLTDLDHTLQNVQRQQALLALPLYVIVAQIVGLSLLFVAGMAGQLIEGQSQDIATLKSRGASGVQILTLFTTQGLLLGAIAAIVGPFLAALLSVSLIRWFIPPSVLSAAGIGANYFNALASPRAALVPAIAGALLGAATVAFSSLQSARLEVLAFRREQARPSRLPLWRRYYLDVALAGLCVLGYLELGQFGSTTARLQLGGSASPLLLLTPALLLLAGALLVLRSIPLAAAIAARAASGGRGLVGMLAFSQVERNPGRYARMTLLLVLAVGLGLFALSFDASLAQNARDQSSYAAGADIRMTTRGPEGAGQDQKMLTRLGKAPGVQSVSAAFRGRASTTSDEGNLASDVLGVDPQTFAATAGVTSWRSDYASAPLATLMDDLRANTRGAPAGTATSPIYAFVSDTFADHLNVKQGDRFTLQLDDTAFGGTTFIVGRVIHEFPTLYPTRSQAGFIVIGVGDYLQAVLANAAGDASQVGPNEYWMKTTENAAQEDALQQALSTNTDFDKQAVVSLRQTYVAAQANPVGTGMRGLLVVGAVTAALLAVLGSIVQSLIAARQRSTQFAILRTLGTAGRQLVGLLLSEQLVVYLIGLVGGTLLGLLLTTATLPFLQFSDSTVDVSRIGVPPYQIAFNPQGLLYFYAALLIAFVIALAISARYAATVGLGQALRLGED